MTMAGRLDGEVALITGAARGQGEAEARMFAREGAQVVLADIREELGQKVARDIGPQATLSSLEGIFLRDRRGVGDRRRVYCTMSYQLSALSSQPDRKTAGLSLWTLEDCCSYPERASCFC